MFGIKISKLHCYKLLNQNIRICMEFYNINYAGCSLKFFLFWRYNFYINCYLFKDTFFIKIRCVIIAELWGLKVESWIFHTFAVIFAVTAPHPRWRQRPCNGLLQGIFLDLAHFPLINDLSYRKIRNHETLPKLKKHVTFKLFFTSKFTSTRNS